MECAGDVPHDYNLVTYSFDSFYSNWHRHPEITAFIPESLSTQGYETDLEAAEYVTEYLAQSKLFSTLQQVQGVHALGGIFVARFDVDKLTKKIKDLEKDRQREFLLTDWKTWVTKRNGKRAENNILLLHPQLGIVLLAVNPANVDSELFQERYDIAKKTAEDAQQVLSDLFCILTNSSRCDIDIEAILCLPEASGEKPYHIYQSQLEDISQMTAFWTSVIDKSTIRYGERNYYDDPKFQNFARFIVSYRSSVTVSARNAHEIYPHPNMKTIAEKEKDGKSVFCLNPRQLSSCLSANRHQILFGLPGTGKTLLIMLLAAEAALESRSGGVVVVTGGKRLVKKYEKSFKGIKCQTQQAMPIVRKRMQLTDISDADHFFTDEMQSVTGEWLGFLQRRAKLKGVYTVIAVSGRAWATEVDQIMTSAETVPELQGYLKLNLKTVVRGTRNIVEYWARKYLKEVPTIGHNDEGEPVVEEIEGTTGGVLYQVKKHVLLLKAANFAHSDISIVTFNKYAAKDIVRYLKDQGIDTCLARNQKEDHVTVDFNNNVLSQEYPAIIVVNYYGYLGASESTEFTALTRAIARLIVIKKDRMVVQREIDKIMQRPENQGNNKIDMASIVQQAADIVNANEQTAIEWKESLNSSFDWTDRLRAANHWDQWLAELRYNKLPIFPMENVHFNECKVFSDAFQVLIDNDGAMQDFLLTHVPEDHPFYSYKIAHDRLQQFNYERALGPDHIDVRDEDMRQVLLRFRDRYLISLEDYLNKMSKEDRKKNYAYLQDKPKWKSILNTVFTLG